MAKCRDITWAVRHQGFIPWDDDADVQMLREDYERFCKVCPQELDNERFFWQTIDTDPGYRWTYGKVRRKGTRYVRSGQEHMNAVTGILQKDFPYGLRILKRLPRLVVCELIIYIDMILRWYE